MLEPGFACDVGIAHLESAFERVAERLSSIDRRVEDLRKEANQRCNWIIGTVVGTWVTTVGMWITTMLTILFHR